MSPSPIALRRAIHLAAREGTLTEAQVVEYVQAATQANATPQGEDSTVTSDWAVNLNFDLKREKKKFNGTIANQLQAISYGNNIPGKLFGSALASQATLSFQVTNYPNTCLWVELYDSNTNELKGVFQGSTGISPPSQSETYDGTGTISAA